MHVTAQPAAPVWQLQCRYRGMYAYGRLNADLGLLYHHGLRRRRLNITSRDSLCRQTVIPRQIIAECMRAVDLTPTYVFGCYRLKCAFFVWHTIPSNYENTP